MGEFTEKYMLDHVLIKTIYHRPIEVKPDEALCIIYKGNKHISTKVIKEK